MINVEAAVVVLSAEGGPTVSLSDFDVTFEETASETPEPATFALLGSALALLGILARKRNRAA